MKAELERRQSKLDDVERFFRDHPGVWLNASDFERVGGRQAWRSRIAECRTKRGLTIEWRADRDQHGRIVASWYRYLPSARLGRDGSDRVAQPSLFG